MQLLPADYVLCGLALVSAVLGLFRGFSGTLAFALAVIIAALAGGFGWPWSASFTETVWMRVGGTLVVVLLAFGIVRALVRKLVNGLLAQPSDALLGLVTGALVGVLPVVAWGWSRMYLDYSTLATLVAQYMANIN